MVSNWTNREIGELPIHIGDGNYSNKYPKSSDFKDVGVPFISASDFARNRIDSSNFRFISPEQHATLLKGQLKANDILVVTRGNGVGKVAWVDERYENCNINAQLVLLRADEITIHAKFLFYLLSSEEFYRLFVSYSSGSAQPQLPIKALKLVSVRFPEYSKQVEIAIVLDSLSSKVEINHQTNQILKEITQTLFKSWFADFSPIIDNALDAGINVTDFPEALQNLAEQRKQAQKSPDFKPLPDDIRSLFPSEFEQTDEPTIGIDGWIPKGWINGNLASVAKYTSSRMDGSELTSDNYVSTENMLPNKNGVTKASSVPTVKTAPLFSPGNILISNIRPYFKKIWLATSSGGRSNDVLGFEALEPQSQAYILNLLYQDQFFDYMMTTSKGSKMPRGDKKAIMDWGVVVPPIKVREYYSKLAQEYYDVIPVRIKESESLTELRDILLPKLISGEISIPESKVSMEA